MTGKDHEFDLKGITNNARHTASMNTSQIAPADFLSSSHTYTHISPPLVANRTAVGLSRSDSWPGGGRDVSTRPSQIQEVGEKGEERGGHIHIMMLTQITQILIQLFHPLLMRLHSFFLQPFVEPLASGLFERFLGRCFPAIVSLLKFPQVVYPISGFCWRRADVVLGSGGDGLAGWRVFVFVFEGFLEITVGGGGGG